MPPTPPTWPAAPVTSIGESVMMAPLPIHIAGFCSIADKALRKLILPEAGLSRIGATILD